MDVCHVIDAFSGSAIPQSGDRQVLFNDNITQHDTVLLRVDCEASAGDKAAMDGWRPSLAARWALLGDTERSHGAHTALTHSGTEHSHSTHTALTHSGIHGTHSVLIVAYPGATKRAAAMVGWIATQETQNFWVGFFQGTTEQLPFGQGLTECMPELFSRSIAVLVTVLLLLYL